LIDPVETKLRGLRDLGPAYMRHRYSILFCSLLFTLVAVPILDTFKANGVLIDLLLAANLLAAIMPTDSARNRPILLTFMIVLWLLRPMSLWLQYRTLSILTLGIWILIAILAAAAALRFAFRARVIDAEHVYAALSAYLLSGLFFGLLYWILGQFDAEAFATTGGFSRMSAIYFSFVTLATLGYGDIVPRTDVARGVAILEAVGGQLFLAVLVARLVSSYSRDPEN
jgi:hypothetical protein